MNDSRKMESEWDELSKLGKHARQTRWCRRKLKKLDEEGLIGPVVLDIGAGRNPVTAELGPGHKIVHLDVIDHSELDTDPNSLRVQLDIGEIRDESDETRVALGNILGFIGAENEGRLDGQVDTAVCSLVFNYVDFRKLISELATIVKPGGRIIVMNKQFWGFRKKYHKLRPQNNLEIVDALEKNGFQLEPDSIHYPNHEIMVEYLREFPRSLVFFTAVKK